MAFNLKSFLRRVPAEVMHEYLCGRHPAFEGIVDWTDSNKTRPEELFDAIRGIPQQDRDTIFSDFENVELLCDSTGQVALHSVIPTGSDLFSRVRAADSNEARGIALLLVDQLVFEHALAAAYGDGLRNGRSWSAYVLDASAVVGHTEPDRKSTL